MKVVTAPEEVHAPVEDGRFANANGVNRVSTFEVLRWQIRRTFAGGGGDGQDEPVEVVSPDPEALHRSSRAGVTWLGHASTLIHLGDLRVLTDPIWGSPPGVTRVSKPPVELERVRDVDVVVLSHNHYDHMDAATLRALSRRALFVVPRGLRASVDRLGARRVIELDWWDRLEMETGQITLVPAVHWSRRCVCDENRSLWGGYVVESEKRAVYFAGDTAVGDHFAKLAQKFELDLALLPIGTFLPPSIMSKQHIGPKEALQAFIETSAARLFPIHWGTFELSDDGPTQAARLLRQLAVEAELEERVMIEPIGRTRWLESRS